VTVSATLSRTVGKSMPALAYPTESASSTIHPTMYELLGPEYQFFVAGSFWNQLVVNAVKFGSKGSIPWIPEFRAPLIPATEGL